MDIDTFAQWLLEEGKAEKTIESYVTDVKGFIAFLQLLLKLMTAYFGGLMLTIRGST